MTDLEDRASGSPDVSLARDSSGVYRLESTELTEADDVTAPGEFPEFGKFLEVEQLTRSGQEEGKAFLECPQGLAQSIVAEDLGIGDEFVVHSPAKDIDGSWLFELKPGLPGDD